MEKKVCIHCRQWFVQGRNPHQQFCSQPLCQKARKQNWRKKKCREDPDYRENQRVADKAWHQRNPRYWSQYRAANPAYVARNRKQQLERKRRKKAREAHLRDNLAKSDALNQKNVVNTGTYRLIHETHPGFAKSDPLIVKISVISAGCS